MTHYQKQEEEASKYHRNKCSHDIPRLMVWSKARCGPWKGSHWLQGTLNFAGVSNKLYLKRPDYWEGQHVRGSPPIARSSWSWEPTEAKNSPIIQKAALLIRSGTTDFRWTEIHSTGMCSHRELRGEGQYRECRGGSRQQSQEIQGFTLRVQNTKFIFNTSVSCKPTSLPLVRAIFVYESKPGTACDISLCFTWSEKAK